MYAFADILTNVSEHLLQQDPGPPDVSDCLHLPQCKHSLTLHRMAALKTPADLGNVILQRRKALGWDQARLAHEAGVSRQWIIEIEKGKPRAELQLVLRALNVLGIELDASARDVSPPAASDQPLDLPDVDRIIEHSRFPSSSAFGSGFDALLKPSSALSAFEEQKRKLDALLKPSSALSAFEEQQRKLDALLPPESRAKPGSLRKGKQ